METIGNPMRREQIKNEWCRSMTPKESLLFDIDEYPAVQLHPQSTTNGVLTPEISVVLMNYPNFCVVVHLAMGEDGLIYSSHSCEKGTRGESSYPRMDGTGYKSALKAINRELELAASAMFDPDQE